MLKLERIFHVCAQSIRTIRRRFGHFYRSAAAHYSTETIILDRGHDRCPVCVKLPLDGPPLGIEASPFEYDLDHNQAEFEQYKGYCSVYRLVRDLHRIWLENGEGDRNKYFQSCGPQNYAVCTDPGVWDVLPASSEAVVHPNPLDPSTIARLQTWIKICDQKHEDCHSESHPVLPTRILDLGEVGSTGIVKLVETNGRRGQYIALSHCWGSSNSFLTTQDTIESRKNGFLAEQAPATFRDAIMLARCLEVRYLWIDSLCIIQRDKKDWNIEASRMGDVYRNSYLMIAAANAADDMQGFLKSRPKIQCSMNVVAPTGQAAKVYLRPQEYRYDDQYLPLDSRGWTLQETYLCRRQLRFMNNKIRWDCQSAQWDESERDKLQKEYQFPEFSVKTLFPRQSSFRLNLYHEWYDMIEDFSTRKFSVQTDRLPALSGLATLVAAQKEGRYCAGFWWEGIEFAICWKAGIDTLRPNVYTAPSWSWASIVGPITFPDSEHSYDYQPSWPLDAAVFHDFGAIQRGSNPYGEIEFAWLLLEAPLARLARLSKVMDGKFKKKSQHANQRRKKYFSILNMRSEEILEVDFDMNEKKVAGLSALFLMYSLERNTNSVRQTVGDSTMQLSGIVLRRTLGPGKGKGQYNFPKAFGLYQRVGSFKMVTHQAEDKFLEIAPVTNVVLL